MEVKRAVQQRVSTRALLWSGSCDVGELGIQYHLERLSITVAV